MYYIIFIIIFIMKEKKEIVDQLNSNCVAFRVRDIVMLESGSRYSFYDVSKMAIIQYLLMNLNGTEKLCSKLNSL